MVFFVHAVSTKVIFVALPLRSVRELIRAQSIRHFVWIYFLWSTPRNWALYVNDNCGSNRWFLRYLLCSSNGSRLIQQTPLLGVDWNSSIALPLTNVPLPFRVCLLRVMFALVFPGLCYVPPVFPHSYLPFHWFDDSSKTDWNSISLSTYL